MLVIFQKYQKTFFAVVAAAILLGSLFFLLQPPRKVATLTLDVTRLGTQQTDAYRYDDFYRLQADEKFADTIVRWLTSSPRIALDIATEAGRPKFSLAAERLSSQMINVKFAVADGNEAKKTALALVKVVNARAQELNGKQKEETWFEAVGSEPVMTDARVSWVKIFSASLLAGVFLGFWSVLLRHYFSE